MNLCRSCESVTINGQGICEECKKELFSDRLIVFRQMFYFKNKSFLIECSWNIQDDGIGYPELIQKKALTVTERR